MEQFSFRRAKNPELAAIVSLLTDDAIGATREDAAHPLNAKYTSAFAAIDHDPNQLLAVVEESGKIVGCLQISFIPGMSRLGQWRGQIESVRIASSHRGKGLGQKMFAWAIEQCRQRGCGLVQLTSDKARPEAVAFYEGLGFSASHEGLKLKLE